MNASTIVDPENILSKSIGSTGQRFSGFAFWRKKEATKRNVRTNTTILTKNSSKKRRRLTLKRFWKRASTGTTSNNHSHLQTLTRDNSTELQKVLESTDLESAVPLTPPRQTEKVVFHRNSPMAVLDWTLEMEPPGLSFGDDSMQLEEGKEEGTLQEPEWTLEMDDDNDDHFVQNSLGKCFEDASLLQWEEEKEEGILRPESEKPSAAAETQYIRTIAAGASAALLLSDKDIERNRMGFKYLNILTQPSSKSINPDEARALANSIIYGGEPESAENLLRYHFASFFCDHHFTSYGDDCDDDYYYDDDDEIPWGLHSGALHLEALKVLINSLQLILEQVGNSRDPIVDFSPCQYWARVFDTLVHNVQEFSEDLEITRFSVKCLRVLYGLNPPLVEPLVKYSLFPFLLNASGCGCSMLEEESELLLEALAGYSTH